MTKWILSSGKVIDDGMDYTEIVNQSIKTHTAVKKHYESKDKLGGCIKTSGFDRNMMPKDYYHYTENLSNHSGNANFKEIALQARLVQGKHRYEPIGKAHTPSFFNYHIISNDMEVND